MPRMVCVRDGIEFRVIKNEVVLAQPGTCTKCGEEGEALT